MKKVIAGLLVLTMVIFMFTGCQPSPTTSTTGEASAETAAENSRPANSGQKYVMRVGAATNKDGHVYIMEQFKKEVEARTDQISVELYPGCQLGSNTQMLQDLTANGIQGLVEPAAFLGVFQPGACVINLPYLFPDAETEVAIMNGECGDYYREYLRKINIDVLGWYIYGVNRGFNTKFPLAKDQTLSNAFSGKKIRVMGSQILLDQANMLGASAVTMDVPEVYTALQQGTIEGMGVAPIFAADGSYYEVAPYMIMTDGDFEVSQFMVNAEWLDSLPQDLYDAVKEASEVIMERTIEYSHKAQDEALAKIEENGGTVIWATEAQNAELKEISGPVRENFLKANPDVKFVYDAIDAAVKAYKK